MEKAEFHNCGIDRFRQMMIRPPRILQLILKLRSGLDYSTHAHELHMLNVRWRSILSANLHGGPQLTTNRHNRHVGPGFLIDVGFGPPRAL